jgi:hypothetical protein
MKYYKLCIGVMTAVQQYMIGKVFIANAQSIELHEVPETVRRYEDCDEYCVDSSFKENYKCYVLRFQELFRRLFYYICCTHTLLTSLCTVFFDI